MVHATTVLTLLLSVRSEAVVRFVVLTDVNSGSTFFQQVFDAHPRIRMYREPLRGFKPGCPMLEYIDDVLGFSSPAADCGCTARHPTTSSADQLEPIAVGFSWHSTQGWAAGFDGKPISGPAKALYPEMHIARDLLAYLQRRGIYVLVLHRSNAIAHFLSSAGASAALASRAAPTRSVDADWLDAWAAGRDYLYCGALCALEAAHVPTHYLTYEEYCAAPSAFVRALAFLGLHGVALRDGGVLYDDDAGWQFTVSTATKNHKEPPSHYIEPAQLPALRERLGRAPSAAGALTHLDACMLEGNCDWGAAGFERVWLEGCGAARPARESSPLVEEPADDPLPPFSLWDFLKFMGPGLMMSLAYIDPGNLEAELQLGAYTGARLIWVLWWATVIGAMLQELAARVGMVSGHDLARTTAHAVRARYPRWLNYTVYVNLELAIMGADLQDLLGTAQACKLLFELPLWVGVLLNSIVSMGLLYLYEARQRYVEVGIGLVVTTVCACFFVNMVRAQPSGGELVAGWAVPGMQPWAALPALGTVGAVIMPHNLFLHSNVVLSRRAGDAPGAMRLALHYTRLETLIALFATFLANVAVVATYWPLFYEPACVGEEARACIPRGLFGHHNDSIAADGEVADACTIPANGAPGICSEVDLADAGLALGAVLGQGAMITWGIGLFIAGQASVLATTYAGQAIMDGFLRVQLPALSRVLLSRLVSIGPAVAVAMWSEMAVEAAAKAQLMQWINAFQALQLPFAMLPTLHFVADRHMLGRFRAQGCWLLLCWLVALLLIGANVVLVTSFIVEWAEQNGPGVYAAALLYALLYFAACLTLVRAELDAFASGTRARFIGMRDAVRRAPPPPGAGAPAGVASGGGKEPLLTPAPVRQRV